MLTTRVPFTSDTPVNTHDAQCSSIMLAVAHIMQQADHASLHTLMMYIVVIDPSVSSTKKYALLELV